MRKTEIVCTREMSQVRRPHLAVLLVAVAANGCYVPLYALAPAAVPAVAGVGVVGHLAAPPGERSPFAAAMFGVFPGFGAGHCYAGDPKTGAFVFGAQLLGMVVVMSAVLPIEGEVFSDGDMVRETVGWIGVGLYLGGWAYDILHAPVVARRRNRGLQGFVSPAGGGVAVRF